jgi:proteasome component ECM29
LKYSLDAYVCFFIQLSNDSSTVNRPLVRSLASNLQEVQQAFLSLLSDPKGKQFSRESSCLGLAACRGLVKRISGSEADSDRSVADLNNRLLRAFGQTTNFGGSAMMETDVQAAARRAAEGTQSTTENIDAAQSEVGGASGIGEAALGAYREMASASVALGRHDILYGLLFLSLSHPYWLSPEAKHRYRYSFHSVNIVKVATAIPTDSTFLFFSQCHFACW